MTNNPSLAVTTKGAVSRTGFVAAPSAGLEVAVRNSQKNPDGRSYFPFHSESGWNNSQVREAALAFERKVYFDCHGEHAAVDNVFTQFSSVLTEARERRLVTASSGK